MKPLVRGAAICLAMTTLAPVANAATPTSVPMASAPPAAPSPKLPSCWNVAELGLPPRLDFTRTIPPSGPSAEFLEWRDGSGFTQIRVRAPFDQPATDMHVEQKMGAWEGDLTWWRFGYWGYGGTAPSLVDLVARYRTELGFSSGETAIMIGDRLYKSYPNGAISVGSLRRVEARSPTECLPTLSCCTGLKPRRGPGFNSTLPGPGDALGDPPVLSGRDALATVHDMNPYVAFVPIDDTGPQRAARLVVVSTRTLESRLAWEVRYQYVCLDGRPGDRRFPLRRDTAYAYVDARSGALVFGQDKRRLGGMVDHDF